MGGMLDLLHRHPIHPTPREVSPASPAKPRPAVTRVTAQPFVEACRGRRGPDLPTFHSQVLHRFHFHRPQELVSIQDWSGEKYTGVKVNVCHVGLPPPFWWSTSRPQPPTRHRHNALHCPTFRPPGDDSSVPGPQTCPLRMTHGTNKLPGCWGPWVELDKTSPGQDVREGRQKTRARGTVMADPSIICNR